MARPSSPSAARSAVKNSSSRPFTILRAILGSSSITKMRKIHLPPASKARTQHCETASSHSDFFRAQLGEAELPVVYNFFRVLKTACESTGAGSSHENNSHITNVIHVPESLVCWAQSWVRRLIR